LAKTFEENTPGGLIQIIGNSKEAFGMAKHKKIERRREIDRRRRRREKVLKQRARENRAGSNR